ncbi:MAG: ribosome recycling factor [Alphaproteobacteria bacterium]|nr:ribosome recycling factor [Alphaproteobacteria bacterium]
MPETLMTDIKRRMQGAIEALSKELAGLRTGRASTALIESVMVEAYGSLMPLPQVGTVSAPEARLLVVQVWDKGMVKAVEKAIRESGLGLNPSADGQIVRVPMPELNAERRAELVKVARKAGEAAKVAVRNIRRDAMEYLKDMEKQGEISEDEHHREAEKVQTLTDENITKIDHALDVKEKDVMQV